MRLPWIAALAFALGACVTRPATPEEQAAYWGPVPEAPGPQQLAAARLLTDYIWVTRPNVNDYVMIYPRDAWELEIEANVPLSCIVQSDGRLACAAGDDRQPKYDFEQAALNIGTRFRITSRAREVQRA
jgi:hypothetical protein